MRHITRWCSVCDWMDQETEEGAVTLCPECGEPVYEDRIITFGATEIYYRAAKDRFFLRHPSTRMVCTRLPRSYSEADYYTMNNFPVAIWHADLVEAMLFLVMNSEELKE